MSDKKLTEDQKQALKTLRERAGGLTGPKRAAAAQLKKDKQAILGRLAQGPATVPQVAEATGLTPARALWCLTALRKYGQVRESERQGDYFSYEVMRG